MKQSNNPLQKPFIFKSCFTKKFNELYKYIESQQNGMNKTQKQKTDTEFKFFALSYYCKKQKKTIHLFIKTLPDLTNQKYVKNMLDEIFIYTYLSNFLIKDRITPHLIYSVHSWEYTNKITLALEHGGFYSAQQKTIHTNTIGYYLKSGQSNIINDSIIFGFYFTIMCLHEIGVQHNDLHVNNILMEQLLVPLEEIIYHIEGFGLISFKNIYFLPKIFDFDLASFFKKSIRLINCENPNYKGFKYNIIDKKEYRIGKIYSHPNYIIDAGKLWMSLILYLKNIFNKKEVPYLYHTAKIILSFLNTTPDLKTMLLPNSNYISYYIKYTDNTSYYHSGPLPTYLVYQDNIEITNGLASDKPPIKSNKAKPIEPKFCSVYNMLLHILRTPNLKSIIFPNALIIEDSKEIKDYLIGKSNVFTFSKNKCNSILKNAINKNIDLNNKKQVTLISKE